MNTYRKIAALAVTFSGLLLAQTPAIKVYVFSSGDSTTDGAVTQALKDRGYQVTLGVRTGDFDGTTVQLTGYDTVVALGSGGNMPAGGITALQRFLQGSGGLILDAPMLDGNLSNDRSGVLVPILPATRCTYLTHIKTGFLRVDPAEPVFDDGVAASFDVSLPRYFPGYSNGEVCLTPAAGSRILFYSQGADETRPRPGSGSEPAWVKEPGRSILGGHPLSVAAGCRFQAAVYKCGRLGRNTELHRPP